MPEAGGVSGDGDGGDGDPAGGEEGGEGDGVSGVGDGVGEGEAGRVGEWDGDSGGTGEPRPSISTVALAGATDTRARQAPTGSRDRSTVTVRVIDSPGRRTPDVRLTVSQGADIPTDQLTGVLPVASRVIEVPPAADAARTARRSGPPWPGAVGEAGDPVLMTSTETSGSFRPVVRAARGPASAWPAPS